MNTKTIPLIIGAVVVVLVGGLVFMNMRSGSTTSPEQTPSTSNPGQYTAAEVAQHNSASSCWSIIDGNVYDLTSWIGRHPGGEAAIKGLCGHDGTAAFHGQHADAKQQADALATFKIGTLAQ